MPCIIIACSFDWGLTPLSPILSHIGDRLQGSVQVSLNQLPRPLGHPDPFVLFKWLHFYLLVEKYACLNSENLYI